MTDLYKAVLSIAPDYSIDSQKLLMIVVYHCRKSKMKPKSLYFSLKESPVESEAYNLYLSMQECPETLGDFLEKAQKTVESLKDMPSEYSEGMPKEYLKSMPRIRAMSIKKEVIITTAVIIIGSGLILTMIQNNVLENSLKWLFKLPVRTLEYRRR